MSTFYDAVSLGMTAGRPETVLALQINGVGGFLGCTVAASVNRIIEVIALI